MGERSESLHLWKVGGPEALRTLKLAGAEGRLLATNHQWATFVTLEDAEAPAIARRLRAKSMLWQYWGDEALLLSFCDGARERGKLSLTWPRAEPCRLKIDRGASAFLTEIGFDATIGALSTFVAELHTGPPLLQMCRDYVATQLELPAYRWLSPATQRELPLERALELYPQAQDI